VLLCAKYTSEADALVSNPNPICGQPLVLVEPMRPALASARCVNGLCSVGESPGPHRTVAQAALLASVRPWIAYSHRFPATARWRESTVQTPPALPRLPGQNVWPPNSEAAAARRIRSGSSFSLRRGGTHARFCHYLLKERQKLGYSFLSSRQRNGMLLSLLLLALTQIQFI
jgi:hypothetical protein